MFLRLILSQLFLSFKPYFCKVVFAFLQLFTIYSLGQYFLFVAFPGQRGTVLVQRYSRVQSDRQTCKVTDIWYVY